ncbi:aldehyde dehydrogenase family protein [Pseudonocardia sp. NPDC049154]|uniref:aldehyde dehydrogenase family protein n=1 Tax=Pseudonocardia sp. NPDC049154 TaxID=3155501 RepID=UPI003406E617
MDPQLPQLAVGGVGTGVRTVLELGGKSPAIRAEDVDLDRVMESLAEGASSFLGQICTSLSRVVVARSRYDEGVERLRRTTAA